MKLIPSTGILRLSLLLLAVTLASGCRGVRIRRLEQRLDQLEPRNAQLEQRIAELEERLSGIEDRMEPRVIPVPGRIQPQTR
jgi:hypothetical protein